MDFWVITGIFGVSSLFVLVLPLMWKNLEFYLSDVMEDYERWDLINKFFSKISEEESEFKIIFSKSMHVMANAEEFKEAISQQASKFIRFIISETEDVQAEKMDESLTNVLREGVEFVNTIEPNSRGLEYALINARRIYRTSKFFKDYEAFRSFTEIVLLDIEQMPDNYVPAILFNLKKSLENLLNNVQEYRARGIVSLIFIDGAYRVQTRSDNLTHAVAKLILEQTSKTAIISFNKYANIVDKRTAQRLAFSIVKLGFKLPDNGRVGANFVLEQSSEDFV